MTKNIADFFVDEEWSIQQVMACIDRNAKGIALVVDHTRKLIDTITDGDIRRALLNGYALDAPIRELIARKNRSVTPGKMPLAMPVGTDQATLLQLMQDRSVRHIPLIDENECVVGLATLSELIPSQPLSVQAVVMAGGFGTRLRPLTIDTPKPMLPIGDRPLLEHIVERLRVAGIHQINITTHHLPEKIKEHFGDGTEFGVNIRYVSEDKPLGTAGAISLMDRPDAPLLVINGDILTQVDLQAMVRFHREHQAELTVGVRQYEFKVPYGVLECDGPRVKQIREKPSHRFWVNAGIYLLQPELYQLIPKDRRFDMTDLIEKLLVEDKLVVSFPIVEYWLDIGQHEDYQRALDDVEKGKLS